MSNWKFSPLCRWTDTESQSRATQLCSVRLGLPELVAACSQNLSTVLCTTGQSMLTRTPTSLSMISTLFWTLWTVIRVYGVGALAAQAVVVVQCVAVQLLVLCSVCNAANFRKNPLRFKRKRMTKFGLWLRIRTEKSLGDGWRRTVNVVKSPTRNCGGDDGEGGGGSQTGGRGHVICQSYGECPSHVGNVGWWSRRSMWRTSEERNFPWWSVSCEEWNKTAIYGRDRIK